MNTPVVYLVYVITGSVAELVSDLLGIGIGSGLVMVPALLWCFQATGVRGGGPSSRPRPGDVADGDLIHQRHGCAQAFPHRQP